LRLMSSADELYGAIVLMRESDEGPEVV
jgi:hypothetical protein